MGEDKAVAYAIAKEERSKRCDAEVTAVMKKYACEAVVHETEIRMNGAVVQKQLKILFVPTEDIAKAPMI